MTLPPGVVWLVAHIPQIVAPPAVVYALAHLARSCFAVALPTWLIVVGIGLSWPATLFFSIQWSIYKDAKDAAAKDAVMPRQVAAKYPGSIDLLRLNSADIENHFLGMCIAREIVIMLIIIILAQVIVFLNGRRHWATRLTIACSSKTE
jgi:hypothetical protein